MEKFIIRSVALLCAIGSLGLAWAFGVFSAIPLRDGRIFAMTGEEMQLIGISFATCLLVAWGAMHLVGLADKEENPRSFRAMQVAYGITLAVVIAVGATWSMARVVTLGTPDQPEAAAGEVRN